MTGITPNDPTSDRTMRGQEPDGPRLAETSGHRRRNVTAAVVALAVVALAVVVVASTRGSRHSEAPPGSAPVSTSPAGSPGSQPTSTLRTLTDKELRAWAATLPEGPMPDVPTLSGRQGHFMLVEHGYRVPVPADTMQLSWSRTPSGLVAMLWTSRGTSTYSDQYVVSYLQLLSPAGRLVTIAHALMGGMATDPSGRFLAWLEAGLAERDPNTVHVVDLKTLREVTGFDEPAWSSVFGWVQAGILITKGGGFSVRSLDGREVQRREGLEGAAANRVLIREGDCLRVLDLGSSFRTALFGCGTGRSFEDASGASVTENIEPVVALLPEGAWMVVDGVSVDVATLTRHGSLMPAGIYGQPPVFFGLDPTHVLVGLKDSAGTGQTIAAIVCEVPAGRCQKVPKPSFGILG